MTMTEAAHQEAVIKWAKYNEARWPELKLLFHIPNGEWRSPRTAAKLQRMGVRPGIPDLCLPVACGSFHGLYIEMKRPKAHPTEKQSDIMDQLRQRGYKVEIARGWEIAVEILEAYLKL